MKRKLKEFQGITLIALVITIIVLLILAGVSISMISSQDGILNKATSAKETQKTATELERVKLAVQSALVDGEGTIDLTKATDSTKAVGLEKALQEEFKNDSKKPTYEEGKVTLTNGDIYNVTTSGSVEKAITFKKTGDLSIGSEVTASNGESFYVIGGDTVGTAISESTQNVILLAKYNLKKENGNITLKQDTDVDTFDDVKKVHSNACAFSSTNYWSSETSYPVNLNDYEIPSNATSIVTTAKEYGESLGVTGRLMLKSEADSLNVSATSSILYGRYEEGKVLYSWLGTVYEDNPDCLWYVESEGGFLFGAFYEADRGPGIRPVIEVLKSSIK